MKSRRFDLSMLCGVLTAAALTWVVSRHLPAGPHQHHDGVLAVGFAVTAAVVGLATFAVASAVAWLRSPRLPRRRSGRFDYDGGQW
jgi:hypothetical protein